VVPRRLAAALIALAVVLVRLGAGRPLRAHVLGRVRLMELVGLVRPELVAGRAVGLPLAAAPRAGPADIRTVLRARPGPVAAVGTALTAPAGLTAPVGRAALIARIPPTGQATLIG